MSEDAKAAWQEQKAVWRKQFAQLGVNQVRAQLLEWSGSLRVEASNWLAEKDHESARLMEASRAEQLEIATSAKDAAFEANRLAAEANSIARDAAASAALSALAARTNNMIATLALIAAAIAIAISILGIFIKH